MNRLTTILTVALMSTTAFATDFDRDGNPYRTGAVPGPQVGAPASRATAVTIYDNQKDFLYATRGVVTDGFEDYGLTGDCNSAGAANMAFAGFSAHSTPDAVKLLGADCFGNHNTTPGGFKYLSFDTNTAGSSASVTLVFNDLLTSLGLYFTDLDVVVARLTINGNPYDVGPTGDGGEAYFGINGEDPFSTVSIQIVGGDDSHWSVDDFTYMIVGPVSVEPASWGSVKSRYASE